MGEYSRCVKPPMLSSIGAPRNAGTYDYALPVRRRRSASPGAPVRRPSAAGISPSVAARREDGRLWLRQATDDYRFGRAALAGRFYAQACFVAQQVAGKATKAVHYELTGRPVIEPSVQTRLRRLNARTTVTDELVGLGGQLDQYYVSTVMGPRRLRHTVPPASRHALRPPLEDRCIEPTRDLDPEDALAAPLAALVRHIG